MAQYRDDFSGHTTGSQPSGFSERWNGTNSTWITTESGGDKFVRNNISSTNDDRLLEWDEIPDVTNVEVLVKCRTSSNTGYQNTIFVRSNTNAASKNGYYLVMNETGGGKRFMIEQWRNGTYYYWFHVNYNWSANTWYYMRYRVNGNNHKAKIWPATAPEPASWNIDRNDTTGTAYNGSGLIAIAGYTASGNRDFDLISVGTNGDTAPLDPINTTLSVQNASHSHSAESVQAPQVPYPNGYMYRKKITIDPSKVSVDLTNFVTLISHTDPSLRTVPNGGRLVLNNGLIDIRYELPNGTKLNHDHEDYSPGSGMLVSWVKVPSVSASTPTTIYMYYGKKLTATEEAMTATHSDYDSVVFGNGTGTGNETERATGQWWAATNSSSSITGKISTARSFVKSNVAGLFKNNEARYRPTRNMTLSLWARFPGMPSAAEPYTIYSLTGGGGNTFAFRLDSAGLNLVKYGVVDQWVAWTASPNVWYHIVAVQGSSNVKYYVNGSLVGTYTDSSNFINMNTSDKVRLAWEQIRAYGSTVAIDTFRKREHQASAGQILTEYNNQNSPSTFYSLGSEEKPLFVSNARHTHFAESVKLVEHKTLAVQDAAHGHVADGSAITQKHQIAVDETSHVITSESPDLLEDVHLTVESAHHDHSSENTMAISGNWPVPDKSIQAHHVDHVELLQRHLLIVESASHSHTADATPITQTHLIVAADATHGHQATSSTIIQHHLLAISDVLHDHVVDEPTLLQRHVLEALSAFHEHTVDEPYVYTQLDIIVQDAFHGVTSDNVTILIKVKPTPRAVLIRTENARIARQVKRNPVVLEQRQKPRLRKF